MKHLDLKGHPRRGNSPGFTLIEMMIVLLIIVFIMVLAVPRLNSLTRAGIDSGIRDLSSVIKDTYNTTMVTGHVHRIVFDIENAEYWVEKGPKELTLETEESREREEERKRLLGGDYKPDVSSFSEVASLKRKRRKLPDGIQFENVITEQSSEPIVTGKGYSHFFPQGLTEQTVVHFKDLSDHKVTLVILPTTGKSKVVYEYLEADEIFERKQK